jgi:hypothetical protein
MDEAVLQEIFEELFQSLETAETQSGAILQFLKAKGIAKDEDLAPYFERASKASSVRLVATRARINHLLSAAAKPTEQSAEYKSHETAAQPPTESAESSRPPRDSKEEPQGTNAKEESANDQEKSRKDSAPSAEAKGLSKENQSETEDKPRTQPEAA